ncbi:MAG: large-conductance mechanosensitive channel protein MscL [Candidatus Peribacteraceae bacterium]|nr:large-conductance mechanosensitive channel protein MscL [Candidatus Peribacteraceae bacterium]
MSFLRDFKDFAMKGNVLDMAIGVIIGGAFGKIVSSLVSDVIMPIIGILLRGVDFSTLSFGILGAQITYGMFLQAIVDFIIIAAVIFVLVKQANKLKRPAPIAAPVTPEDIVLLREIRDALKAK